MSTVGKAASFMRRVLGPENNYQRPTNIARWICNYMNWKTKEINVDMIYQREGINGLMTLQKALDEDSLECFKNYSWEQKRALFEKIKSLSERGSKDEGEFQTQCKITSGTVWTADKAATWLPGAGGIAKAGISFVAVPIIKTLGKEALKEGVELAAKKGTEIAGEALVKEGAKVVGGAAAEKTVELLSIKTVKEEMLKRAVDPKTRAAIEKAFEANDTAFIRQCYKHIRNVLSGTVDGDLAKSIGKALTKYVEKAAKAPDLWRPGRITRAFNWVKDNPVKSVGTFLAVTGSVVAYIVGLGAYSGVTATQRPGR